MFGKCVNRVLRIGNSRGILQTPTEVHECLATCQWLAVGTHSLIRRHVPLAP